MKSFELWVSVTLVRQLPGLPDLFRRPCSRRYQEDHIRFMTTIRQSLPLLATKKLLIVTDREFDFSEVFPLCLNVFCWNHLERDLHFYLKNTANCQSSEISFYANAFKFLMIEESEVEFDKSWMSFKESNISPCVLRYFEQKVCQHLRTIHQFGH